MWEECGLVPLELGLLVQSELHHGTNLLFFLAKKKNFITAILKNNTHDRLNEMRLIVKYSQFCRPINAPYQSTQATQYGISAPTVQCGTHTYGL